MGNGILSALRNVAALRVVIFALLLCVAGATTFAAEEKPYKATNVDECIQEKECVWEHFLLAIQQNPQAGKASKAINLKKWEKPVRIRIDGEYKEHNYKNIEDRYLKQLLRQFPQHFSQNQKYNFYIKFTDSVEAELKEFGWFFEALAGKNLPLEIYERLEPAQRDKCYYLNIQHPKQGYSIYSYFAFLDKSHPNMDACIKGAVYAGFGLSNVASSPIWDEYKNKVEYSNLEKFLLLILQQKEFKSGMSYEQTKIAFDKIYPKMIDFIKVTGAFDEH